MGILKLNTYFFPYHFIKIILPLFWDNGDGIQDLAHAKEALYHRAAITNSIKTTFASKKYKRYKHRLQFFIFNMKSFMKNYVSQFCTHQ